MKKTKFGIQVFFFLAIFPAVFIIGLCYPNKKPGHHNIKTVNDSTLVTKNIIKANQAIKYKG